VSRVLVVEDEESWSEALAYMLRKEGFEVAVAATGPQALSEFDRTGGDLVLLDLMLPQMSGLEVCRQLRSRSDVPIIMVSARDSEIDKVVGLEIGADDYVTKPYSLRELLARIRAVLRRRGGDAAAEPSILTAGPVCMDIDRHVVTVDGGFAMLMAEFHTAARYGLPIKVVISNNNVLGQILWEQMLLGHPEHGVRFGEPTPDYAACARGCGGFGAHVDKPSQVADALSEAFAHPGPALVDVAVDPHEPPMPGKITYKQATRFMQGWLREPHRAAIATDLFRDRIQQFTT
jgi:DNA-binding response OmpR family regulator